MLLFRVVPFYLSKFMTNKIYIALVGGQPVPVYTGLRYVNPDKMVLICSRESREEAERIEALFEGSTEVILCDPVDLKAIRQLGTALSETYAEDEVVLNVTSGTKAWSIVFYEVFRNHKQAHVIYIDQNNKYHDFMTDESIQLDLEKDIHYKLYGSLISSYKSFTDYTSDDEQVMQQIQSLRIKNLKDYNYLTAVLDQERKIELETKDYGTFRLNDGSFVEWDKTVPKISLCLCNKVGNKYTKTFESPNVMSLVFNSGWFEYKTALAFSKIRGVREIRMNCLFKAQNDMPKNEVDMILDMGNKLIFVECKTQIHDTTAIDKFHSVLKNYAGMGTKGIFVTDSPIKENAKEKCKNNDLLIFSFDYRCSFDMNVYRLAVLIDEELQKINKR